MKQQQVIPLCGQRGHGKTHWGSDWREFSVDRFQNLCKGSIKRPATGEYIVSRKRDGARRQMRILCSSCSRYYINCNRISKKKKSTKGCNVEIKSGSGCSIRIFLQAHIYSTFYYYMYTRQLFDYNFKKVINLLLGYYLVCRPLIHRCLVVIKRTCISCFRRITGGQNINKQVNLIKKAIQRIDDGIRQIIGLRQRMNARKQMPYKRQDIQLARTQMEKFENKRRRT